MMPFKVCVATLGLLVSQGAFADSPPLLELPLGWYDGYNERFLEYQGLRISNNGNHLLISSHLSWGLSGAHQTGFSDADIQCSHVECVVEIPEPDHEGLLQRLVLSPSVSGGWHVMQTSVKPDGEFVATNTYEFNASKEYADAYFFKKRYDERVRNLTQPGDHDLDGLWIGVSNDDIRRSLVALELEHGEPAKLVTFAYGNINEQVFAANEISEEGQLLSMTARNHLIERNLSLHSAHNSVLTGSMMYTFSSGETARHASYKLIRVRPSER